MITKTVHYERLVNLGNYENEKLRIDVEIEPGETIQEAVLRARSAVDQGLATIAQLRQDEQRAQWAAEAERLNKAFGRAPEAPKAQTDPAIVEDTPF